MGKVNRREFFEEFIANKAQQTGTTSLAEDPIYNKYANKERPRGLAKTTGTLSKYTGQWTENEVTHLLRRTMFGVTYEDVVAFKGKTMEQCVDELLSTQAKPYPPLNNYQTSTYTDPTGVLLDQPWVNAPYGDSTVNSKRRLSMTSWWIEQMLNQKKKHHRKDGFLLAQPFCHRIYCRSLCAYDVQPSQHTAR